MTEEPISPEFRLAICLYRLGRGDYLFTISEMTGYGAATCCKIVIEVSNAILKIFGLIQLLLIFQQARKN